MEAEDANAPLEPRPPTLQDLVLLCRSLNRAQARYVVIGGWAVIQQGFDRTTSTIDLLVEDSPDNFQRLQQGMLALPDGAIRDVAPDDLEKYVVVRVGDEFVVDLMKQSCGILYAEASKFIVPVQIEDVLIPLPTWNCCGGQSRRSATRTNSIGLFWPSCSETALVRPDKASNRQHSKAGCASPGHFQRGLSTWPRFWR